MRLAMVKFVESDSTGLPLKRKQVAQACNSCRKRKKRCVHEGDHVLDESNPAHQQHSVSPTITTRRSPGRQHSFSYGANISPTNSWPQDQQTSRFLDSPQSQSTTSRASRFVGDLNPEHFLIEATSPNSSRDLSTLGGIGIWQTKRSDAPVTTLSPLSVPDQSLRELVVSHVRSKCMICIPPPPDWFALRRIYYEKMDPLYPVIDRILTEVQDSNSTSAILVKQVICMAASANPESAPHLRFKSHSPPISRQEFCAALSTAVQTTLDANLLTDRILLTRILLLFSMYMQPNAPEEADLPAAMFSRVVHQMHTIGLHVGADKDESDYEQMRSLFLCIWSLDSLNAALYGRACLVHDRDIGWDFDECIDKQPPAFRLFLRVIQLLNQTITLYRPSKKGVEGLTFIDLPITEQMIMESDAVKVPSFLLATIEILYHSVSILSCRFPEMAGSTDAPLAHLPTRSTNPRRSLSADRITDLIQDEFPKQLSYMPIIPYALSLSLSVAYRKMRYSNIPMYRDRGRRAFIANTALLKELGEIFWTARTTSALADQVLQQMDKAVASMAQGLSDDSRDDNEAKPSSRGTPLLHHHPTSRNFRASSVGFDNEISIFETAPELDVFTHFDPAFNLGGVDAALEGNLNLGTSSNWFDWQQVWGMNGLESTGQ